MAQFPMTKGRAQARAETGKTEGRKAGAENRLSKYSSRGSNCPPVKCEANRQRNHSQYLRRLGISNLRLPGGGGGIRLFEEATKQAMFVYFLMGSKCLPA